MKTQKYSFADINAALAGPVDAACIETRTSYGKIRAALDILIKYGLNPAFADAVEDPGRLFGSEVSDQLIDEVNIISTALYSAYKN